LNWRPANDESLGLEGEHGHCQPRWEIALFAWRPF
jgi:hypothetical protein